MERRYFIVQYRPYFTNLRMLLLVNGNEIKFV